jgi:hypothetical protein
MTSLMEYAEELAMSPPVVAYQRIMKLNSEDQLAMLDSLVNQGMYKETDPSLQSMRQAAIKIASKYEDMKKEYGEPVAKFSVTSICDFIAMSTMVIGAGIERIEALKRVLHGKTETTVLKTDAGDQAFLFLANVANSKSDNSKAFEQILSGWCQGKGNGVVQFKFPAGGDFHTFAVERISTQNNATRFIVYQAYQNTYSLAHFLGLVSAPKDNALASYHKLVWDSSKGKGDFIRYRDYNDYVNRNVQQQFQNIDRVTGAIGGKQELDANALKVGVIQPLATMLKGGLPKKDYASLTGSSTSTFQLQTRCMAVLMCHEVSPQNYKQNCAALYNNPAITNYLDCGPKQ